jgi:hypothetical protein
MKMTPEEVDKMSLWEFQMVAMGYAESQGSDMDTPLTEAEIKEIGDWI